MLTTKHKATVIALAILSMTLAGCATVPEPLNCPEQPKPIIPADCLQAFPNRLTLPPAIFGQLSDKQQATVLNEEKAQDSKLYGDLRDTYIRCQEWAKRVGQ